MKVSLQHYEKLAYVILGRLSNISASQFFSLLKLEKVWKKKKDHLDSSQF